MRRKLMEVMVLGTKYTVYTDTSDHDEKLLKNDGYIAPELKWIVLDSKNRKEHQEHVLKHELTHAYLYESGLDVESWGDNEEIVDWIAIQCEKITATKKMAWDKVKAMYDKPRKERRNGGNEKKDSDVQRVEPAGDQAQAQ